MSIRIMVKNSPLKQGPTKWQTWRDNNPGPVTVEDGDLSQTSFASFDLTSVTFDRVTLNGVSFHGAQLAGIEFAGCTCVETQFSDATGLKFKDCLLGKITFSESALSTYTFDGGEIRQSNLPPLNISVDQALNCKIIECNIEKVCEGTNLEGAKFDQCTFKNFNLKNVNLSNVEFQRCTFEKGSFLLAKINAQTRFDNCIIKDHVKIHRYTIEMLKDQGLPRSQWPDFEVEDPVKEFRSSFSGIMQYVHVAALTIFLFPYVLFIAYNYWMSLVPLHPGNQAPLSHKLWQYLVTAGTYDGHVHVGHVAILCFLLCYNLNRAMLLWKTKVLESDQELSGLPVHFNIAGWWKFSNHLSHYGMFINVCLVLWHTYNLFQVPVSMPAPPT